MNMADEIITLAVYSNVIEAQIACNRLLADGIPARLDGEMAGPLPGMESALATIRLLVPAAEAERASELLGFTEEELTEPEPDEEEEEAAPETAIRAQGTG